MRSMWKALALATVITCSSHFEVAQATRKALVIGIDDYQNVRTLENAVSDATVIAGQLRKFGYDAVLVTDAKANRMGLVIAWQKFLNSLHDGDDAILFYSGHGIEIEGTNYFVPSDSPTADELGGTNALKLTLLSVPSMIADLNKRPLNAMIWVIDACRDNPFITAGRALGSTGGLASMEGPPGMFVFYSANYGQTALDRLTSDPPNEKNSIYTRTLLRMLRTKASKPVYELARDIRPIVRDLAKPHDQRPAYYDGLDKPWCFTECDAIKTAFENNTRSIFKPTTIDISEFHPTKSTTSMPNAVFLGKRSSFENCNQKSMETHPFGCDVLNTLVTNKNRSQILLGKPLVVTTDINVRKQAPIVEAKTGAAYACVVDRLKTGDTAKLTGILELTYLSDTFYWGTLERTPKSCPKG